MESSNQTAVTIKNLCKAYKLYSRPGDRLKEALHPMRKSYHREFLALKNISLSINKSETVGIIGQNGSGKSTLLKLITGVLTPTSGTIEASGKIAALLELGAGFNPELNGYENIYLNGAIMGYSHAEIESKMASILDFADIGQFVDQPLRSYSSGMFVRLAFAMAINTDPDILIVDEALSVGDLKFQQKCYRAIKNFISNQKTVLFVGHDLAAISTFCTRCIWMDHGVVKKDGNPADVTRDYALFMSYGADVPENKLESKLQMNPIDDEKNWISTHDMESIGLKIAQIEKVRFLANGRPVDRIVGGEEIEIYIQVSSTSVIEQPIFGFVIKDRLGTNILGGNTFVHEVHVSPIATGVSVFKIGFKMPYLTNGEYLASVALADGTQTEHVQQHWVHDCCLFKVANHEQRFSNGDGLVLEKNFSFLRLEGR